MLFWIIQGNSKGSVMGTTWPTYPGFNVVGHLLSLMVNKLKVNVKGHYCLDLYDTRVSFMSAFSRTLTRVLWLNFHIFYVTL